VTTSGPILFRALFKKYGLQLYNPLSPDDRVSGLC
jgi:hypothetical protein